MSDSRIGIELDGARATLVAVVDGAAVYAKAFGGATPADALATALAGVKRHDRVRIALVTPGSSVRRLDVTGEMLTSRAAFEDAVYNVVPVGREGTTAAGLFFNPDALVGSALGAGVCAVAPADLVDGAYAVLGKRRGEVVPPAFTLSGADGLHLAVRDTVADLTLVADGHPVAYRQMTCRGLDVVAAPLGDGTTDLGRRRLAAALVGDGAPDPAAVAEVDRYLRTLAAEVRQTCDVWARAGYAVPAEVSVFGPGAVAAGLDAQLRDVGLTRTVVDGLNRALATLPPQQRPAAVGAYLAAVTAGQGAPAAAYPNPVAIADAAAAARRSRTTRQLVAVLAVLAAAGLAAGVPIARGAIQVTEAQQQLAGKQQQLADPGVSKKVQTYDQVHSACATYKRLTFTDPAWNTVVDDVYNSAATYGAQVNSLAVTSDGTNVSVSVTAAYKGDFTVATAWMGALRKQAQVNNPTPTSISGRNGQTSVSFTFTAPVAKLAAHRAVDTGRCPK